MFNLMVDHFNKNQDKLYDNKINMYSSYSTNNIPIFCEAIQIAGGDDTPNPDSAAGVGPPPDHLILEEGLAAGEEPAICAFQCTSTCREMKNY